MNLNARRHWKFRTGRAEAAFNVVRRLSRLPPQEKRKVVIGKLLSILTYGSELHTIQSGEGTRLATRMPRWVVMGYQGSSRRKLEQLTGIGQLEELTHRKGVRGVASVYARHEPQLLPRAKRILEEDLWTEPKMIWMEGVETGRGTMTAQVSEDMIERQQRGEAIGYTDGSRMEGVAAGESAEGSFFLGTLATVMDAEMVGIAGAWEEGYDTVATDSRVAITRCVNITAGTHHGLMRKSSKPRGKLNLIWVKGHAGEEGNEAADRKAKDGVRRGIWESDRSLVTPAGIRQAYPLYAKEQHMKWDRDELRGLTYLHTDRGPFKAWLFKIKRAENPFCLCGETQNATHIMTSGCVGGKRRTWEDIWTDREFCGEVTEFLRKNVGDGEEGAGE